MPSTRLQAAVAPQPRRTVGSSRSLLSLGLARPWPMGTSRSGIFGRVGGLPGLGDFAVRIAWAGLEHPPFHHRVEARPPRRWPGLTSTRMYWAGSLAP